MRNLEFTEVVRWYEKQLGRKMNKEERMIIRHQYAINNNQILRTKDLEKYGICLYGIRYE